MRESQAFFSQFRLVFAFLPSVIVASCCCCCFCCWFTLFLFFSFFLLFLVRSPTICSFANYNSTKNIGSRRSKWSCGFCSLSIYMSMYVYKASYHYLAICAT
ncbi:hypothetical protein BDA96_07G228400 [Sorghum bicolor]|uniref:Uncharacterized protein n=2 Tax=Sorghum bicolor TaxID=4558 RepID=A0A1B6PJ06_SORBI|nr:hypothetical protein BDA96_07G228400 [Sorghum bicolor]KXG25666.1 hypothetical protein SORBI_3007G215100 [Sorghum bicolor]